MLIPVAISKKRHEKTAPLARGGEAEARMFGRRDHSTAIGSAIAIFEVTYHATVRNVQKGHGNAVVALLSSIMMTLIMVMVFYLLFTILGARGAAVRGDFILYLLSGVFLYRVHVQTVSAVMSAEPATSGMMNHAPMNSAIAILAVAFGTFYIQFLALLVVLVVYHSAVTPITIDDPAGAFYCFVLAWAFGVVVGMIFYALKPWAPTAVTMVSTFYRRANMIFSGKMFLANTIPGAMLPMFYWNPLFHLIDQSRGFTFINYYPRVTSIAYALWAILALLVIGMMWEFYTKRQSSISWGARR